MNGRFQLSPKPSHSRSATFFDSLDSFMNAALSVYTCLQDRGQTLETHAGVDVLVGQVLEAAVTLSVVLNEHHIPDLQSTKIRQGTRGR